MSKTNLKNPCLSCDQLNEDKNKNPKCIPCTLPAAYDKAMGDVSGSLPYGVSMDGDGGYQLGDLISYGESEEGDSMMSKKEEVEILIESICEDNLVTHEALLAGGRAMPVAKARHAIIEKLVGPEFKMEQRDISKLVGVTYAAVNLIVGKLRKAKEAEIEDKTTPSGSVLMIHLNFTGLEDIYEWIDETAKAQLRTRENLILFIIKEKHGSVLGARQ